MPRTIGRIDRTGTVHFHDASISVWEEGLAPARAAGGPKGADAWERQFKRQVFYRIVQTLNRLGWTVAPWDRACQYKAIANSHRTCSKGDLRGELDVSGRAIKFEMWQGVNTPTRPDHGGRYESDKEACMPYVLRLEMERTRRRIRDYLCNVFTGYTFSPPKIASPNPDPLTYFNDKWDGEHEKRRGTHRFDRGADGWPSDKELGSWGRKDKDGVPLNHGDVRWLRDRKGRLMRGSVYGGINGMWMFVYGPGQRDYTYENAGRFFTYRAGEMQRKVVDERVRRKRLEQELARATAAMNFERAAVLRDVLFPPGTGPLFHVRVKKDGLFWGPNCSGYTHDSVRAGKYTKAESERIVRGEDHLEAVEATAGS